MTNHALTPRPGTRSVGTSPILPVWTALAVLGTYGYLWIDRPEYLSWWKRSVDALIESGSAQLPYPWGDRIESTIGNFGIWVQVTLAILIFRAALGILLLC